MTQSATPNSGQSTRAFRAALLVTTALTASVFAASPASAANWTGAIGDWFDPSNWNSGVPTSGDQANINNGGTAQVGADGAAASSVWIGQSAGQSGALEVTGPDVTLSTSGGVYVGFSGSGTLDIFGGGVVNSGGTTIAATNTASGSVTVDGEGSAFNIAGFTVGHDGEGTLDITNGGYVFSTSSTIGGGSIGSGAVTIDGAGSYWESLYTLYVGYDGEATLDISNGGAMSGANAYVGFQSGSTGAATVDGEGSTWSIGSIDVGSAGSGTLAITNGGAVSAVHAVVGNGAGSSGAIAMDGEGSYLGGTGILHIGVSGSGALTIADGAAVEFLGAFAAVEDGSSATVNIGAASGDAAVAAGAFNVAWLSFGSGTGELVFNHTDTDYVFGTGIYGSATLRLLEGSTTLSGNSSSFSGTTTVEGGALIVNGSLGGSIDVADARLGGSGTVGTTVLGAGAVIAPGNSVGMLTVDGDLTFDADSTYEVEVDTVSRTADRIYVTGIAYLNGASVSHVGYCGCYPWYMTQTILTADGGIDGTFSGITSDFAFLTPDLAYDANNVRMTLLRNDIDFTEVTQSPNQTGVASAANGLGPGNPVYDEILMMTEEEARAAFDALSGEAYGSAGSAAFASAQQLRDVLQIRLQMFSGGQVAASGYVPAAGDAVAADAPAVWGQFFGSWGTNDATATAAKLDRRSSGFLGGADKAVGETSRIGFVLGYSRSSFDVSARASSGDSDNVHIAGYAGTELGSVDLDGTLGYSYGRSEATRTVIVGGLTNNLAADYDTHTVQASVEAGMDVGMGSAMLTPFAGLAVTHVRSDGFTETGGPAALTIAASDNTTGTSTLGLRLRREAGSVALTGSAAWRHAFGDVDPSTRAAFASAPASPFITRGTPVAENTLALGGDIDLKLDAGTTLTFGYAGEYASDARDHGLRAEMRVEF